MNNTPTPETDAAAEKNIYGVACKVDVDFARKLERERDEAREALEHVKEYGTEEINAAIELRQKIAQTLIERDEAREAAAMWESSSDAMERAGAEQARRADENCEWALRAERERDEAREEIEALRHEYHGAKAMAGGFKDKIKSLTEQRDEAREAMREAWLACMRVDVRLALVEWRNKHASILEEVK